MSMRTLCCASLALLAVACELPSKSLGEPINGDETTGGTAGETDGQTSGLPGTTGTTDEPQTTGSETSTGSPNDTDGGEIMCGVEPEVFPAFAKQCATVDDCAVAIHQTDCCGNMVALGLNKAEIPAFDAAEAICESQYPGCGCPSMGIVAEDGSLVQDPAAIELGCVEGLCKTYVSGCAFLVGKTFLSVDELECGLGPNGVELCQWSIAFMETLYSYQYSDVIEEGAYTCDADTFFLTMGKHTGTVDANAGTLMLDGHVFAVQP